MSTESQMTIRDYAIPDDTIPPEVDALNLEGIVPVDEFPLTPIEAWMIMRGYYVKPRQSVDVDKLMTLPGVLEMSDGFIAMKR